VMNAGRIVQVGEPAEVYEHPRSRFVADFIGSVNMFEGRVREEAPEHVTISTAEGGGEIYVGHGISAVPNQQVWYAIRPEKLRLGRERPERSRNVFRGEVEEVAYVGNLSIYRLRLESGKILRATITNLERHTENAISWDETVWVSWGDDAGAVLTE
jgi:putrescine transport system ATP-binding protein